ncbi:hypothetical protein SLS54_006369 [Diplodia seriata]
MPSLVYILSKGGVQRQGIHYCHHELCLATLEAEFTHDSPVAQGGSAGQWRANGGPFAGLKIFQNSTAARMRGYREVIHGITTPFVFFIMEFTSSAVELFRVAIDCFGVIQLARNFDQEFATCQLKLDILQLRLSRWGEVSGINKSAVKEAARDGQVTGRKDQLGHSTEDSAEHYLTSIRDLLDKTKYKADRMRPSGGASGDQVVDPNSKIPNHLKVVRTKFHECLRKRRAQGAQAVHSIQWVFYKKDHFEKFIEDIASLLDSLEQLFPDQAEKFQQLSREECQGITKPNLEELEEINDKCDPWMEKTVEEGLALGNDAGRISISQKQNVGQTTGVLHGNVHVSGWNSGPGSLNHLQERHDRLKFQLLYFYVDISNERQKDLKHLLLTFREQVLSEDLEGAENELRRLDEGRTSQEVQSAVFKYLAKTKRPVRIIIDALDKLSDSDRIALLTELNSLFQKIQTNTPESRVALFITSRDCNDLKILEASDTREIRVEAKDNAEDIRGYLKNVLDQRLLPRMSTGDSKQKREREKVKKKVLDRLADYADGMFLWANLQVRNICLYEMKTDVLRALEVERLALPNDMEKLYKDIAEEFEEGGHRQIETSEHGREVARRTIALLAHATRPIPRRALLVAVSLEIANGKSDEKYRKDLNKDITFIVQVCKHLVELDEQLGAFRFCHASVVDFFRDFKAERTHVRVAELCLSHLCSDEFSRGPFEDASWYNPRDLETFLDQNPFLEFASFHWPPTVRNSMGASRPRLLELCERSENLRLSFQVHMLSQHKTIASVVHRPHVLCYFGLVEYFETFRERRWLDPRVVDDDGLAAIHWAIKSETESSKQMVSMLLHDGGKVNLRDSEDSTPLHYAAWHGKLDVVKLLIEKKADVDVQSRTYGTALSAASHRHHAGIIQALLDNGADPNSKSKFGTPLHAVASIGCKCQCTRAMLDHIERKSKRNPFKKPRLDVYGGPLGGTALHAAAYHGQSEIVDLLLDHGFDAQKTSTIYGSTLATATAGCYEALDSAPFVKIVQRLVKEVDVNMRSGIHGTALHAAATLGRKDLVGILLANGADVTASGPMGTPYQAARDGGYDEIMTMLKRKDPRVDDEEQNMEERPFAPGTPVEGLQKQHHQYWVRLFRAAVAMNDGKRMDLMVAAAVSVFVRAIKQGQNNVVAGLAAVGEGAFEAVVSLATQRKAAKTGNPSGAESKGAADLLSKVYNFVLQLLALFFYFLGLSMFAGQETDFTDFQPNDPRRAHSFPQTSPDDQCPTALDSLTRAAVFILQCAFENGNEEAVAVLANAWVRALFGVMSCGEKKMVEILVEKRANELKQIFINPRVDELKRFEQARKLAEVGVELLVTALKRGQEYRPLASCLANLWVAALRDVEHLGRDHRADVRKLVFVFAQKFEVAVDRVDKNGVAQFADAGVEIMASACLSHSETLVNMLAVEWVGQLAEAIRKGMGPVTNRVFQRRAKQYQACLEGKKPEDATALATAIAKILHAAICHRHRAVAEQVLETIVPTLTWTFNGPYFVARQDRPESAMEGSQSGLDIGMFFRELARIISVAGKAGYLSLLAPLLRTCVTGLANVSLESCKALESTTSQEAQRYHPDEEESNRDSELKLEESSTAVSCILSTAMQDEKLLVLPVLVSMGINLLDVMRKQANGD